MDRTIGSERQQLGARRAGPGMGAPPRPPAPARARRRLDLALLVAVAGLIIGGVVLASLLRGIVPSPPSVLATPGPPQPDGTASSAPAGAQPAAGDAASGVAAAGGAASGVAAGVAYSALSAQRVASLAMPASAGTLRGNLVIVKVLVRGVASTPSTASLGAVGLVDGAHTYQPLLPVARALSHTLWHALVSERLAPGASSRVKLFFEVPRGAPPGLALVLADDSAGARRLAIPAQPRA
jgi:hypothetical protein